MTQKQVRKSIKLVGSCKDPSKNIKNFCESLQLPPFDCLKGAILFAFVLRICFREEYKEVKYKLKGIELMGFKSIKTF